MKSSISFVCQECGYESLQWLGKCPECGAWNSLKEFKTQSSKDSSKLSGRKANSQPKKISDIGHQIKNRIGTGFSEMDGVLGGGIVEGSVVLLAGDPGIGKSTLLLQLALEVAGRSSSSVLYVSGEESEEQIKMRAQRLDPKSKSNNLFLFSQNNIDEICSVIEEKKPSLVIVDSIQTMESENLEGLAGSVGQVRYAALNFIRVAKELGIPIILVGHVTKEGMVAGPMILSHMVDVVLFLEGEKTTGTRILRGLKNRFGPIDEVGVFVLESGGMQEIKNPQSFFLTEKDKKVPGSVLVATIEGTRAFLVEIQALVVFSKQTFPRRVAIGVDSRRLELLLAVLQKHCRLPLDSMDVFVNVAGGMKLTDPAIDLGVCLAIFSSFKGVPMSRTVGIAEVGLLGELRNVSGLEKRIKEARKIGFTQIISSKTTKSLNDVLSKYK